MVCCAEDVMACLVSQLFPSNSEPGVVVFERWILYCKAFLEGLQWEPRTGNPQNIVGIY